MRQILKIFSKALWYGFGGIALLFIFSNDTITEDAYFYPEPKDYNQFIRFCNISTYEYEDHHLIYPLRECYEGDSIINFKVEEFNTSFWGEYSKSFNKNLKKVRWAMIYWINNFMSLFGYDDGNEFYDLENEIWRMMVDEKILGGQRGLINGSVSGKIARVEIDGKVEEFILSQDFIINNNYGLIYHPPLGKEGIFQLNKISDALEKSTETGTNTFKNSQEIARIFGIFFSSVFTLTIVFFVIMLLAKTVEKFFFKV